MATNPQPYVRWSPLSGVVFVVLFIVGAVLATASYQYPADPEKVQTFFNDHTTRVYVGVYLVVISAFFMMAFGAAVWVRLRSIASLPPIVPGLIISGAVISTVLLLLYAALVAAAADRAGASTGISEIGAITLYDLSGDVLGMGMAAGFGVMIIAIGVGALRAALFPQWFVWLSIALGVLLFTPINWAVYIAAMPWIAAVSVWLYMRPQAE